MNERVLKINCESGENCYIEFNDFLDGELGVELFQDGESKYILIKELDFKDLKKFIASGDIL